MSDSLASSEIISKPIGAGVRRGDAVFKRRMPMRFSLIAAVLPALFVCNGAMAQVSGMAAPTPTMGATSPLGLGMGSSVSPTGIPMGATEIASPGVSPMPTSVTGTIAMPGSGTTCSTAGTSPSGMYGSTATYDGGGTAAGAAMPATAATSGATAMSATSTSSGISATSGMHVGNVGNVRLRLKQYRFIVDSNVNVAHNTRWRRSNRTSVGIYRDWQPWG